MPKSDQTFVNIYRDFMVAMLNDAVKDSPAEIEEWCKSDLCKSFCSFVGQNINEYKQKLLRASLRKQDTTPIIPYINDPYAVKNTPEYGSSSAKAIAMQ